MIGTKLSSEEKDKLLLSLIKLRNLRCYQAAKSLNITNELVAQLRKDYPYYTVRKAPRRNKLDTVVQRNMVRTMLLTMSPLQIHCMCGDPLDEIYKLKDTPYEKEEFSYYDK